MYPKSEWEQKQIELARARLDLEQQKAELAVTRAEAQAEANDVIGEMAKAQVLVAKREPLADGHARRVGRASGQ